MERLVIWLSTVSLLKSANSSWEVLIAEAFWCLYAFIELNEVSSFFHFFLRMQHHSYLCMLLWNTTKQLDYNEFVLIYFAGVEKYLSTKSKFYTIKSKRKPDSISILRKHIAATPKKGKCISIRLKYAMFIVITRSFSHFHKISQMFQTEVVWT